MLEKTAYTIIYHYIIGRRRQSLKFTSTTSRRCAVFGTSSGAKGLYSGSGLRRNSTGFSGDASALAKNSAVAVEEMALYDGD